MLLVGLIVTSLPASVGFGSESVQDTFTEEKASEEGGNPTAEVRQKESTDVGKDLIQEELQELERPHSGIEGQTTDIASKVEQFSSVQNAIARMGINRNTVQSISKNGMVVKNNGANGNNTRIGYMQFALNEKITVDDITDAKLILYAYQKKGDENTKLRIGGISNASENWTTSLLVGANRPVITEQVALTTAVTGDETKYELDVTSYLKTKLTVGNTNGKISFAFENNKVHPYAEIWIAPNAILQIHTNNLSTSETAVSDDELVVRGIHMETPPTQVSYGGGWNTIDLGGGEFVIEYVGCDETSEPIDMSGNMIIESVKNKASGRERQRRWDGAYYLIADDTYIVTVKGTKEPYKDRTISFEIDAEELVVKGIRLLTEPTKLIYERGKYSVDLSGGEFVIEFANRKECSKPIKMDGNLQVKCMQGFFGRELQEDPLPICVMDESGKMNFSHWETRYVITLVGIQEPYIGQELQFEVISGSGIVTGITMGFPPRDHYEAGWRKIDLSGGSFWVVYEHDQFYSPLLHMSERMEVSYVEDCASGERAPVKGYGQNRQYYLESGKEYIVIVSGSRKPYEGKIGGFQIEVTTPSKAYNVHVQTVPTKNYTEGWNQLSLEGGTLAYEDRYGNPYEPIEMNGNVEIERIRHYVFDEDGKLDQVNSGFIEKNKENRYYLYAGEQHEYYVVLRLKNLTLNNLTPNNYRFSYQIIPSAFPVEKIRKTKNPTKTIYEKGWNEIRLNGGKFVMSYSGREESSPEIDMTADTVKIVSVKDKKTGKNATTRADGKYKLIRDKIYIVTVEGVKQPYMGHTTTFEIAAKNLRVALVDQLPNITSYGEGWNAINLDGGKIAISYINHDQPSIIKMKKNMSVQSVKDKETGESAQIREDGKYNLIKGRDYIVTVRGSRQPYEDLEITFEITAVDLIINGIRTETKPYKLSYGKGEAEISLEGGRFVLTYANREEPSEPIEMSGNVEVEYISDGTGRRIEKDERGKYPMQPYYSPYTVVLKGKKAPYMNMKTSFTTNKEDLVVNGICKTVDPEMVCYGEGWNTIFLTGGKFGFTYSNYDRPLEQFDMETQLVVDSVREKSSGQSPAERINGIYKQYYLEKGKKYIVTVRVKDNCFYPYIVGKTTTFEITAEDLIVNAIRRKTNPVKTIYVAGWNTIDLAGSTFVITYKNCIETSEPININKNAEILSVVDWDEVDAQKRADGKYKLIAGKTYIVTVQIKDDFIHPELRGKTTAVVISAEDLRIKGIQKTSDPANCNYTNGWNEIGLAGGTFRYTYENREEPSQLIDMSENMEIISVKEKISGENAQKRQDGKYKLLKDKTYIVTIAATQQSCEGMELTFDIIVT